MKTTTPTSLLTALLCCALLPGCAWIAAHPNTVSAVETNLVKIGATFAKASMSNGSVEMVSSVPLAIGSLTDVIQGMQTDKAAALIKTTVNQFTASAIPDAALNQLVAAYKDAAPETPAAQKQWLIGAMTDLSAGISKTIPSK